jgi:hypothetical protein
MNRATRLRNRNRNKQPPSPGFAPPRRQGTTPEIASNLEVRGVAWSDFDQVDTLAHRISCTNRVCACNAKPTGVLCRFWSVLPWCGGKTCPNTPGRQCVGLFCSLTAVLAVCSVLPTLLAIVPSVTVAHVGAIRTHDAPRGSSVVADVSTFVHYVALGAAAQLLALLSRLPWLSFQRSVYARAIVVLRACFLPRALVTTTCSMVSSVVLYYVYARSSGVGGGLAPGVRGGGGDHVWGQLLYVCPAWGGGAQGGGQGGAQGGAQEEAASCHHTCVNQVQWLSFLSAVAAGWLHAFLYLVQERYVLHLPIVQQRRWTRLCPRLASEAVRGPVLAGGSTLLAYVAGTWVLSRAQQHRVVTTVLAWLYGNLSGTGGLLDTTDPSLAYAQSHHLLHGLFLCWSVSAWVHVSLSMSQHLFTVFTTHALHANVADNLMTWSTWLVGPTVRGRYRVSRQSRWDAKLVTRSMQRSTTVVMNEMRRRQERATRRFVLISSFWGIFVDF